MLAGGAQPDTVHFGQDLLVAQNQTFRNATCFLCSVEVTGRTTGGVRVFAGNVLISGSVGGDVLIFGGNLTLRNGARVGGRVFILGGRIYSTNLHPLQTVFAPIIFLPLVLLVGVVVGCLIFLTRRMVRGPIIFPPLPRL
jgi:hypothetical protein